MNQSNESVRCLPHDDLLDLSGYVSMFASVEQDAVMQFLGGTTLQELRRGDTLIENGSAATTAYLVVSGELEVTAVNEENPVVIGVRGRGDLVGEMALLTGARRNATLRARTDVSMLAIESDHLNSWLMQQPVAILNILRTAVARMKSAEADMVQHQHLAALGTLAAGLAHELNNPASALLRSASRLGDAVLEWEHAAWELGSQPESRHNVVAVQRLRDALTATRAQEASADPITRSNHEQEIQVWLNQQHMPNPWQVAPVLVDRGWKLTELQSVLSDFQGPALIQALHWLAEGGRVQDLLHEVRLSAQVIGDLVSAVKSYSRLDEAPIQVVDLHEGIEQSLIILRYQLRGVHVVKNFVPDLPRITAFASQLNQLWTNLIDNAAAAMHGSGTLTISTARDGDAVIVDVEDTGPGIPEAHQDRVFEPFFTTKPPGQGTGLGLAISYSTVRKHGGSISIESQPGHTRFRVRLPLEGPNHL